MTAGTPEHTPDGLLKAWEQWDKNPENKTRVEAFQTQLNHLAQRTGTPSNRLRETLNHHRRNGHTRRETLALTLQHPNPPQQNHP